MSEQGADTREGQFLDGRWEVAHGSRERSWTTAPHPRRGHIPGQRQTPIYLKPCALSWAFERSVWFCKNAFVLLSESNSMYVNVNSFFFFLTKARSPIHVRITLSSRYVCRSPFLASDLSPPTPALRLTPSVSYITDTSTECERFSPEQHMLLRGNRYEILVGFKAPGNYSFGYS